jgi:hypothetical protein
MTTAATTRNRIFAPKHCSSESSDCHSHQNCHSQQSGHVDRKHRHSKCSDCATPQNCHSGLSNCAKPQNCHSERSEESAFRSVARTPADYCGSSSATSGLALATGAAAAVGFAGATAGDFAEDTVVDFAGGPEVFAAAVAGAADDAGGGFFTLGPVAAGVLAADVTAFFGGTFPATRYFRIFSSFFGPMPRTANKSFTLLKGPYDLRICKILSAVDGPIPGTCCSCAAVAVFKLIGAGGGFLVAETAEQTSRPIARKMTSERSRQNMAD